jgi:hypothetical protein
MTSELQNFQKGRKILPIIHILWKLEMSKKKILHDLIHEG